MLPPLDAKRILVTRPAHQAKALSAMLSDKGADVMAMAVMEIKAIAHRDWQPVAIDEQAMIVFVSSNAVQHFVTQYQGQFAPDVDLVAVGAATAQCLEQYGLKATIQAPPPAGSESLLAMPEMQSVAGKGILIVRGETGRALLGDTLAARGANISYLAVYQRCLPTVSLQKIECVKAMDWIIVTSVAGLENLCQIVNKDAIKHKMLLVVSERIGQVAVSLGFEHIVVTSDVSDTAIVDRLVEVGRNNGK